MEIIIQTSNFIYKHRNNEHQRGTTTQPNNRVGHNYYRVGNIYYGLGRNNRGFNYYGYIYFCIVRTINKT